MAYNAILGSITAWFPEKRGTASGILLMGFGASSLVLGGLADSLIGMEAVGWRKTYIILGIAIALILIAGSSFAVLPKSRAAEKAASDTKKKDIDTRQMLGLPSFWVFFLVAALTGGIGTGVIGHAKYIALEAGSSAVLSTFSVGLISVCNGVSRVITGLAYDKLGRAKTMLYDCFMFIISCAVSAIGLYMGSVPIVIAGLIATGLAYGGVPPISAAFANDFYGEKNYASNLSIINLSLLPASFASLLSGSLQTASGSYLNSYLFFGGVSIAVLVLNLCLRRFDKNKAN